MTVGRSLHLKLLLLLAPPVLAALVLGMAVAYKSSISVATEAHDLALTDLALALSQRIRVRDGEEVLDLPRVAEQVLKIDQFDTEYFAVRDPNGRLLGGEPDLVLPEGMEHGSYVTLFDSEFKGRKVRAAYFDARCEGQTCGVLVAETTVKRDRIQRQVLIASVVPQLILALFAAVALWVGVKAGLRPLEALSEEIKARSPKALRAISGDSVPREVEPLVSALNQLFGELGTAHDNQRRFIANAAHQLRTPLAGLQTHAELAMQYPVGDACRTELQYVHSGVARTVHLANQLLALARAEPGSGRAGILAPVDLAEVVTGCADEWVHRAMNRGIDLGFDLKPARLTGDRFLLGESVINLIANAVEYTPGGGRVTVRTGTSGREAWVEVEDDGPGIPEAERRRVLERFYRVEGTGGSGSGLGLAIVNETALMHGGRVEISSGKEQAAAHGLPGCCVKVLFPAG